MATQRNATQRNATQRNATQRINISFKHLETSAAFKLSHHIIIPCGTEHDKLRPARDFCVFLCDIHRRDVARRVPTPIQSQITIQNNV